MDPRIALSRNLFDSVEESVGETLGNDGNDGNACKIDPENTPFLTEFLKHLPSAPVSSGQAAGGGRGLLTSCLLLPGSLARVSLARHGISLKSHILECGTHPNL